MKMVLQNEEFRFNHQEVDDNDDNDFISPWFIRIRYVVGNIHHTSFLSFCCRASSLKINSDVILYSMLIFVYY